MRTQRALSLLSTLSVPVLLLLAPASAGAQEQQPDTPIDGEFSVQRFEPAIGPRNFLSVEGAGGLRDGDAARFSAEGGPRIAATEPAEVLVWQLP